MTSTEHEIDGLKALREEVMGDPVAKAAYEDANRRTAMLAAMPRMRKLRRLTQRDVAKKMHTTQSAVSDIESGNVDPQLRTLQRYARAIRRRLDIAIVDEDLPVYDEGMAAGLWELVEHQALSPLLTGLRTRSADKNRTLNALARFAHLPPPVVRPILGDLQEGGWITSVGSGDGRVYALVDDARYVIGLSLHRDAVRGVLLDLRSRVIARDAQELDTPTRANVMAAALAVIDVLCAQRNGHELLGIGVSIAGVVETDTGTVRFAPDLCSDADSWTSVALEVELQDAVQERLRDPELLVAVENDANVLALAEYLERGERSVVTLLLSQSGGGIGVGFVVEGDLVTGENFAAGEGGHIVVDRFGEPCRSGANHRGCLETISTAGAILHRLGLPAETHNEVRESLIAAADRVRTGDEEAAQAFRDAGMALGHFLAQVMVLFDPSRVAIYGHKELMAADSPSGKQFQSAVLSCLEGGVSKGEDHADRVHWHQLTKHTDATAAGAAAMRDFLYRPVHWRPSVLARRGARVGEGRWL